MFNNSTEISPNLYAAIGQDHNSRKNIVKKENRRLIIKWHFYSKEKPPDIVDDISLLELESSFELGEKTNIYLACFLDAKLKKFNNSLILLGYGKSNQNNLKLNHQRTSSP